MVPFDFLILVSSLWFLVSGRPAVGKCGQVIKGAWWMSWHREAMKDVAACDKPREAGKQALIRGFLNAETRRVDHPSPAAEFIGRMERTQGTETSKYLKEKRQTWIP